MDRDRGVAEHGLGPGGRDDDEAAGVALERLAEVGVVGLDLALLGLGVGDRGVQLAFPVD